MLFAADDIRFWSNGWQKMTATRGAFRGAPPCRSLDRDDAIDREHANATFRNGVLAVTLPKTEAAKQNVRRIPVNGKAA